jgi:hypothetical protein
MRVLKPLPRDAYTKENYVAHASQTYEIVSGSGTNPAQVTIDIANQPPSNWPESGEIGYYNSETGIYAYQLFAFLKSKLYSTASLIEYSTASVSSITQFIPTGSLYVFNLANEAVGDGIVEGSFSIAVNDTTKIVDDSYGRLYVDGTTTTIGNIFYKHGIAVVKTNVTASHQSASPDGLRIVLYAPLNVAFTSSATIYEHKVVCRLEPTEFTNTFFNPSMKFYTEVTGSYISGSTAITYSNYDLTVNPSASAVASSGESILDLFASGTIVPYVTTIGLYQDLELVAVAKLAHPIPRTKNVPQTFIIKFDT